MNTTDARDTIPTVCSVSMIKTGMRIYARPLNPDTLDRDYYFLLALQEPLLCIPQRYTVRLGK